MIIRWNHLIAKGYGKQSVLFCITHCLELPRVTVVMSHYLEAQGPIVNHYHSVQAQFG